jgi:hypothetical protein
MTRPVLHFVLEYRSCFWIGSLSADPRKQLDSDHAKLPPNARTAAARTHKARLEARMKILDEDINRLKTELRASLK